VLLTSGDPLLANFTFTVSEPGVSTSYSDSSNTSASTGLQYLISSKRVYGLKLPDDFKVTTGISYAILKNGQLQPFSNAAGLTGIFPSKKAAINDFIKAHQTRFSVPGDVKLLMEQMKL
jgi:hypothetical protein